MGRRPSASREKYVKYWLHFIITWEPVVLATLSTLVPPSLTTLFSAFSHPPRSYRGVSSFSFSLSLSFSLFPLFRCVVPWFSHSRNSVVIFVAPSRVLRFLRHRTDMDMCACPTPTWAAAHVLMCLHLSEQGDSRSRFLYDAYRIKRETRRYTPILKTIAILKWKNKEN